MQPKAEPKKESQPKPKPKPEPKPDEVALAQEYGFQSCTLGPRILRCETAPLCALTAILYAAGALD